MSGIAGIVSADGAPPDGNLLERMTEALLPRGPDGNHKWSGREAGFCFTLLRTGPAPQAPTQPLTLDNRVWLLADVRLDGREELRRRLEQRSCALPAEPTDEELLLHSWRSWGKACLAVLRGDFSFAIWDEVARTLVCARDPLGAKPFFYAHAGATLIFSNTLDAARTAPWAGGEFDPRAAADFLLHGWCPEPDRTIYRDVRRLPAGHTLKFRDRGLEIRRYAELPIEEPLRLKHAEEYAEAFREQMAAAVRDRLPRDSAAILLSGGLDSGCVAAMASDVARRARSRCELRAFTVDFRPLFDDEESVYASQTAAHLQIPLEIFAGGAFLPYERWDDSELRTPEPCHEPFLAQEREQLRRLAAHARVALSGYGGDDVLNGQSWPYLLYLVRRGEFGRLLAEFGSYFLRLGRIPPLRGGFRARLRGWFRHDDPHADYPPWLNDLFEKELNLHERWRELQEPPKLLHPVHPWAYAGLTSTFWPSVLEEDDPGWTGVAVEARAPLLDWRMLTFLLRVPPVPWCAEKYLLRRALRGLLPDTVRRRAKTPLREDPLVLQVRNGAYRPVPLPVPAPAIEQFVDWPRLQDALSSPNHQHLWRDLRPLSLNYWLKRGQGKSHG